MPHSTSPSGELAADQHAFLPEMQSLATSSDVSDECGLSPSWLSPSPKLENEITMLSGPQGYNFTSAAQALAYRPAVSLFPDLSSCTAVTIVDYGCSGVANSIAPLKELLNTLPDGAEATIILNDRPYNDWNEVSRLLKERWKEVARDGEIKLFVHMNPVSFFNQVVKSQSVDIGMSFTAFNYLEHVLPTPIHPSASMDMDAKDLTALQEIQAKKKAAQAHVDLVKLLRLRATETKTGGTLVTALASCKDQKPGSAGRWSTQPITAAFQASLSEAAKNSLLSEKQVRAFNFPMHEHHISDVRAAIAEVDDLWAGGEMFQERIVHPAYVKFSHSRRGVKEVEEYVEAITGWVFGVLSWYLVKGMRSDVLETTKMRDDLSSMSEREVRVLDELREGMKRSLRGMLKDGWDGETGIEYVYLKLVKK